MNKKNGVKEQKENNKKIDFSSDGEKRFRHLIEQIPLGYQSLDKNGHIIDVNERWLETLGYSREEVIGRWFGDFLTPKSAINFKRNFVQYKKTGELHDIDLGMVMKNGSHIVVSFNGRVGYDEKGNFRQTHSIMSNITERKRMEKQLIESEEKYRNIFENAMVGIFQSTPEGRFLSVNPALAKIHGFKNSQEMMKEVTDLGRQIYLTPADREKWKRLIESQNNIRGYETKLYRKDKKKLWLSVNARTVRDANGKVLYYEGIVEDITERKRAEEQLKKSKEKLKALTVKLAETEEAQRQMLARELHDKIGQNLTAIGINLNIIKSKINSKIEGSSAHSHVSDSMALVDQTAEFVRNLMIDLRTPVLDDYGLIAALQWYGQLYEQRTGINVVIHGVEPEPRLQGRIEQALFRIVQEALTNIAKHAKAADVEVSMEEKGGIVRLIIKDNGVGFDFHRLMSMDRRKTPRGWGLMIMAERIEAVGGRLRIRSDVGRGTEIMVEVVR